MLKQRTFRVVFVHKDHGAGGLLRELGG